MLHCEIISLQISIYFHCRNIFNEETSALIKLVMRHLSKVYVGALESKKETHTHTLMNLEYHTELETQTVYFKRKKQLINHGLLEIKIDTVL